MNKVAIPINGDLLSEQMTIDSRYKIFTIDNKTIDEIIVESSSFESVEALASYFNKTGITYIIGHSIDESILNYFCDTKINLFVGVSIKPTEIIINEYLSGSLLSKL